MYIAVCDDEKNILDEICNIINNFAIEKDYDIHCVGFSSSADLLKYDKYFDLYILDYQLKGQKTDGIMLAEKIRKMYANAEIAFATSFHEIVYDKKLLTEIGIKGFLRKPVRTDELEYLIDQLIESDLKNNRILLKKNGIIESIIVKDIMYVEAYQRGIRLQIQNDSKEYVYSLAYIMEKLPEELFVQSHRSFIVNMEYIEKFDSKDIYLTDGSSVPLSKYQIKDFRKKYETYIFKKDI